jgi:hypothetical protein
VKYRSGVHVNDALFGTIENNGFGWLGECSWSVFGQPVTTRLFIPCDEREIGVSQREAFALFEQQKSALCNSAADAIFSYYQQVVPEYRARLGSSFADGQAPEISSKGELARLVTPTELIVQESFAEPTERVIGLLFDCTWDTSLGLAVKFVDEKLSGVGPQDIVL